jgi:fluoride ion exporter CrcB/FEX
VGFFGAMSTMSTFTTESVRFLFDSEYGRFALNVVLNVGVCLVGAIIGRELSLLV